MVTIDHMQLRYRPSSPIGAWTYLDIPIGQGSIQISDYERSTEYDFQVRNVSAGGQVSDWVSAIHTVATTPAAAAANPGPTNLYTTSEYNAIHLYWTPANGASYYQVETSQDGSGDWTLASGNIAATDYRRGTATDAEAFFRVQGFTSVAGSLGYSNVASGQRQDNDPTQR